MRPLRTGDKIGVVAPSSPFDKGEFLKGIEVLEGLGFRVIYGNGIFNRHQGVPGSPAYLARDDRSRAKDLMGMFTNSMVRAILCVRGGYGAMRLIPMLDLHLLRKHPKPLVGYSDITFLMLFLLRETRCPIFHGPLVSTLGSKLSRFSIGHFREALTSSQPLGKLPLQGLKVLRPGKTKGRLTGGCLSLVTASLGTPSEIQTDGSILFLEDQGEAPYRIDRMLTQLRQAGKLNGVKGLVFGQMPKCGKARDLLSAISSGIGEYKGPVLMGFPSGHVKGSTFLTLPLGVNAEINGNAPSFSILQSPFS